VHREVARVVVEDDQLTGVELTDGNIVPRGAVFVRPINAPHPDDLLAKLGCELDDAGFAVVDHAGRTSVPGVWGRATPSTSEPR
jgi:thioredoxin reductase